MQIPTRDRGVQYKVQYYDLTVMGWKDIQKRHDTYEEAKAAAKAYARERYTDVRLMEIDNNTKTRRPLTLFTV